MSKKANLLINEKSQYLLQHAYNPVDWYPWTEEAFERAKLEDKPVFLSIGYSTCHWCHVMEKESFEDNEVAQLMNDAFISIKVDREERPDIDGVYMKVCQMITGSGGWPLTIIMTPDKKPFFVGTYFPKRQRFNRIGMIELIPKIKEFWLNKRAEIIQSADEITKSLNRISDRKSNLKITQSEIEKAYQQFEKRFDSNYGGFGEAPKFPSPHNLIFLMNYHYFHNSSEAIKIVENTLIQMRLGGIYDHIGFGFCRYSTDRFWLVPHFEKMLYDQALLLISYVEAYQITKSDFFYQTSKEIIEYVSRVLTSDNGGFFCAEDADSDGEEGKFYLWSKRELEELLPQDFRDLFIKIYNVEERGNYHDESKGIRTGKNILHLKKHLSDIAKELNFNQDFIANSIEKCRKILFETREKRIHPLRDEKILTDWNALMISALTKSYLAFREPEYLNMAERANEFVLQNLLIGNSLLHRFKDGEVKFDGNIDDYSFFIQANLDLFEATGNTKYLKTAISLNNNLTKNFWDEVNGGYYFTSSLSEKLITRQKELYDGAIPSGNSVQLMNLIRFYRISQENKFIDLIEKQIEFFSDDLVRYPSAYSYFLTALIMYYYPSTEIIVSGDENEVDKAYNELLSIYIPNRTMISLTNRNQVELTQILPYLKNYVTNERLKIFICNNFLCKKPVDNLNDALKELNI